jgi:hypothetical protein
MRRLAALFVALAALALLGACSNNTLRLDPNKGSVEGGDTISIFGGPFGPGVRVEFGGQPVGTVSVASPEELRIVVPRGEKIGPVDIVITDAHGARTEIPKGYEYLPRKDTPTGTGGSK